MVDPLACGDLLACRRYVYARALGLEGDWRAAAEMLEQALERAPNWAPALFALGEAREKLGDVGGAAEAFRACLVADPSDAQGAAARLALLGRGEPATALPRAYVARLFDEYAPRFNQHLTEALAYCGPQMIAAALQEAAPERRFAHALDLGCGAGLMGEALRAGVDRLTGVDLSPAMIARARAGERYDALEVGDVVAFLRKAMPASCDLLVAADVLVYLGDLAPLFEAAARALRPDGLFAFTVEALDGEGFALRATLRFAHARAYVEAAAAAAGLRSLVAREAAIRREAGVGVPGRAHVLAPG